MTAPAQFAGLTSDARRKFVKQWLADRQRGRTDLLWLCKEVLGFKDIVEHAHGPILDSLQKFHGRKEWADLNGILKDGGPVVPLWDLEGPRNHLILYPRGHLKTTLNCVAHSIQWILNYPDCRILITTATELLSKQIMTAIQQHFEINALFRMIYPEFCAPEGKTIGNSEQFTVPNRSPAAVALKEPTCQIITVTSAMAGIRCEVLKHSDVIDQINCRTPAGLEATRSHFRMCAPLLERGQDSKGKAQRAWRTVEGTIYDFSDYHAEMYEQLTKRPDPSWKVTHRSCWANAEKTATIWPERFSVEDLQTTRAEMGDELFANQYELNPVPEGSGLATREQLERSKIPKNILDGVQAALRLHVTIDLAGLEKESTGDYTVITLAGFDRSGRMYVLEVHRAHFDGHEVVEMMFDLDKRYHHKILDFKIEKEAHARGLRSTLEREQEVRQRFLMITYLQRDTRVSKVERIKHSLKYWFANGLIRINEEIPCWPDITDEVLRFPRWKHDDILDTLVDQTQNQSPTGVESDIMPRPKRQEYTRWEGHPFTGFGPRGEPMWGYEAEDAAHYHERTGV